MPVNKYQLLFFFCIICAENNFAQINTDGFYPGKKNGNACLSYSYEHFNDFYLGSGDLAEFSGGYTTNSISLFASYGITDDLAISAFLPYISVSAQDMGEQGLQDFGFSTKYQLIKIEKEKFKLTFSPAAGFSFPLYEYELSDFGIGQQAKSFDLRLVAHLKTSSNYFAELQGGGLLRFDPAPNGVLFLAKTGYAGNKFYTDVSFQLQQINSGDDLETPGVDLKALGISYQKINATLAYNIKTVSVFTSGGYVLNGENIGKAFRISAGGLYRF